MYSFTEIKTYYYYERAHSDNFSAVPSYRENLVYWSCINTQGESKQAYPYVCDDALFACTKCHRIIWQDETQRYKDQQVILKADNIIVFLYRKQWWIFSTYSLPHPQGVGINKLFFKKIEKQGKNKLLFNQTFSKTSIFCHFHQFTSILE